MFMFDLISALAMLDDGGAPNVEPSTAELQARRDHARRFAMMQRPAFGLAAGPV